MIVVVGAGISGVACAQALIRGGQEVLVLDRGRRIGGRMAMRTVSAWDNGGPADGQRHAVDIGASYLTASDPAFRAVVDEWCQRGLARPWTDTFGVSTGAGIERTTTGPLRYASANGLRTLVEDLARGLDIAHPVQVKRITTASDGGWLVESDELAAIPTAAVVVAAPDPQAARILPADVAAALYPAGPWPWQAVIAVAAAWPQRWWDSLDGVDLDGVFVNDDPTLTWIADDGRRRGDGAAVLVAHTTTQAAAGWLSEPAAALEPVLAAVGRVLGAPPPPPSWSHVQRWGLAKPLRERPAPPFLLYPADIGVCGDAWGGASSVEGAWLSGDALGRELARRLA